MFEDPELHDPFSLTLNENYHDQNSPCHESKKSPASPDYSCETPEIQVIIKEEEEGWTVSENHENFCSEGEREDDPTLVCHPDLHPCGNDSSVPSGAKTHQRHPETRSEERSCSTSGAQHDHLLTDSEDKPVLFRVGGKKPGSSPARRCNNAGERRLSCARRETDPDCRGNGMLSEGIRTAEEGYSPDLHCDGGERTSVQTEEEEDPTKSAASHSTGHRRAPEEEEEKPRDEEISGLINSDGEVVEWDRGASPDRRPGNTEATSSSQGAVLPVVSVGDDEERMDKVTEEKVVAGEPVNCGKRLRRKNRVPEIPVQTADATEAERGGACRPGKRRGSRKAASDLPVPTTETEPGVSRRTRGKRIFPVTPETDDVVSKSVRRAAGKTSKRPNRKRKDAKAPAEEGVSKGKKRPGRKRVLVPIEIPPELLKTPKEKVDYHCSVCGKEFPHAYKLERHQLIHTGEKPYSCSLCGRGFNQKGNLKTHYKVHFGRKGAVDFDDEVNPIASELSEYLKSLPGESRIRSSLHCLECGSDYESQSALQAHHVSAHAREVGAPDTVKRTASELLFCRRCGVQFAEKDKLEEHMKTHVKEKPYSCPDCGKRFINESYIQIHQRLHTGEKPFLCSQCGRGFHTASSLKLHEMQHSGEKPFACSICGKKFRINSYLTAHYQTHIKDRPFICSVCGKGYSRAEELKVHHRLHTGERPYECRECGKSFIYRQGLRQHQRTHAGRRIGPTRQLGRPKQHARLDI